LHLSTTREKALSAVVKNWHLLPHDPEAVDRLARAMKLAPVVAQLLLNRGVEQPEEVRRFLDAPLSGLHPPEALPGVAEAADLLLKAVREGRKIRVYGDYDVDGITGTAILKQVLHAAGGKVDIYVPHRLEEGYGLNHEALTQIAREGDNVVVTVDCGIASIDEAELARGLGLELIVTDHHEMKDRLPAATVLVHPRLPGTSYPFCKLSGAAVAFKLAWCFATKLCGGEKVTPRFREILLDGVAYAALGIVADVVPLWDENRIIVKHGLARLRKQPPLGLKALMEVAGIEEGQAVRASDIGFKLAPRMNAAGRLGCARLVVDLLTTTSPQRAGELARVLEEQNSQRQTLERTMLRTAREQVDHQPTASALVLASGQYHPGVVGIVASRLVDLYGRPTLMIALRNTGDDGGPVIGQGSGRSIPGFALHSALEACGDLLLSHGGHHQAAGLKVLAERIDELRERFCAYTSRHFPEGPPPPTVVLDAEVPLAALTAKLVKELDHLEPYGSDNNEPLFLAGDLQVEGEPRKVGQKEQHLSFRVRQGSTVLKAIAFGMAERVEELMSDGGACCLAFTPKINEWQGRLSVDLVVEDIQAGPRATLS
jgi:single-stranded-DNA-specific exonuclease